jgi:hypothetical protein
MNKLAILMIVALSAGLVPADGHAEDNSAADSANGANEELVQREGRVRFGPFRMRDHREFRNMVTLSPGVEWFGSVGYSVRPEVVYHRLLPHRLSVRAGASVGRSNEDAILLDRSENGDLDVGLIEARSTSAGIRVGLDWYPIGNGMHGAFTGPRLEYDHGWTAYAGPGSAGFDATFDRLVVEAAVGWRWVWDPGLSFSLAIDGGFVRRSEHLDLPRENDTGARRVSDVENWWKVGFELTLGWAF